MFLTDEMPTGVLASTASEFRHLQIVPAETMFSTTIASEKVKLVEIKNLQELKWCLEGINRDMLCLIDQRNIISETIKWGQVEDGEVCIIRKIGQEQSTTILVNDTFANNPNLKNNINIFNYANRTRSYRIPRNP